ncbi:MAG: hypothetical protein IPO63_18445 [Bacteroidetes bacterium]|nr:hypothetical protein [Bacteroidota bacterium]
MRKFCIVLLLVSYLVPAIGVGVNLHWCGHVLYAFSMNSDEHQNCLCTQFNEEGEDAKSDCCKDDYAYYKLSQQHVTSTLCCINHFDKSPIKNFISNNSAIALSLFLYQRQFYFFSRFNTDESPPDLLKLGILRV